MVEYASYTIGVFLCTPCSGIHRGLGSHISRVKSIKMDNWDRTQVSSMEDVGNKNAKAFYEKYVPVYYKRPKHSDPQWVYQISILFSICVHHSAIWFICNSFLWHFGSFSSVSWKNTGSEQSMKGRNLLLNQLIWEATVKDSWMDICWRKGRRMETFKRGNSY